jgi:low affinity Fe/Cu permease
MNGIFRKFATTVSEKVGAPWAFILAISVIAAWAITGPLFNFSDTWQLMINTSTTIVTFLMVFVIQNTQNRDAKATQIKLDELIKSIRGARDTMVDVEELTDEELEKLQEQFRKMHKRSQQIAEANQRAKEKN